MRGLFEAGVGGSKSVHDSKGWSLQRVWISSYGYRKQAFSPWGDKSDDPSKHLSMLVNAVSKVEDPGLVRSVTVDMYRCEFSEWRGFQRLTVTRDLDSELELPASIRAERSDFDALYSLRKTWAELGHFLECTESDNLRPSTREQIRDCCVWFGDHRDRMLVDRRILREATKRLKAAAELRKKYSRDQNFVDTIRGLLNEKPVQVLQRLVENAYGNGNVGRSGERIVSRNTETSQPA